MRVAALALCLGWIGAAGTAVAAEPPEAAAQRQQIKQERAAAEERFKRTEAECKQRFSVSGCVADAEAERRATLATLRLRELALDDAKRQAEAAESRRRLESKRAEAQNKPPPVPHAASEPRAAPSAASAPLFKERTRRASQTADEAAEAAARALAQQRRASDAAAHRQEVEQRNAERAARGKKSQPLPVPSAASVAEAASAAGR